jgi:hypothetical protein
MRDYPRELTGVEIPQELEALVRDVAHRLVDGSTHQHEILRDQLAASHLDRITLTGAGLFAYMSPPEGAPRVVPGEMTGGEVLMNVQGLDAPAGSLMKVSRGHIAFIEIYTYGNASWPDRPQITSFGQSIPMPIP